MENQRRINTFFIYSLCTIPAHSATIMPGKIPLEVVFAKAIDAEAIDAKACNATVPSQSMFDKGKPGENQGRKAMGLRPPLRL
jgi:hypothetical protein